MMRQQVESSLTVAGRAARGIGRHHFNVVIVLVVCFYVERIKARVE